MYGSEERGSYKVYPKCSFLSDFIVSREMAQEQVEKAEKIIQMIEPYLKDRWGD